MTSKQMTIRKTVVILEIIQAAKARGMTFAAFVAFLYAFWVLVAKHENQ
jgi:hypothetical protein